MLTPEQKRAYQENGYLVIPKVFEDDLAPYRKRAEELLTSGSKAFMRWGRERKPAFFKIPQLARDDVFRKLADFPRLKAAVEDLVGQADVFRDVLVGKPPETGSALRYHQDAAYWDTADPDKILSAWIALDDSPVEAGCLQFIPGSHRKDVRHDIFLGGRPLPGWITNGLRRAVSLTGTGDNPTTLIQRSFSAIKTLVLGSATKLFPVLNDLNEISVDHASLPLEKQVAVPARAGDVVLFHSRLLHASGPNTSKNSRRAYIVTYVGKGA